MKNLKAKLRRDGGFTLVEMLIVVAIIAILVAVSIPVIGSALESARDATDRANERAAKAEAVLAYLGVADTMPNGCTAGKASTGDIYYNAVDGALTNTQPKAYGKCTDLSHLETLNTNKTGDNSKNVLKVSWDENGKVTLVWTAVATS